MSQNMSTVIKALEAGWKRIQSLNSDVPDAVILVGSGGRRAGNLYGHFAKEVWAHGLTNTDPVAEAAAGTERTVECVHEVLIVAEHLYRPAEEIFTTLLHEAVHGIATSREIKDCSGKRHNKKFAMLCEEVGLIPPERPDDKLGFSSAVLDEQTAEVYKPEIDAIRDALSVVRLLNLKKKETKKTTWLATCQCERKLRLPKKTIDAASAKELQIACGVCKGDFVIDEDELADFQER